MIDLVRRVLGGRGPSDVQQAVRDTLAAAALLEMLARCSRPDDYSGVLKALPNAAPSVGTVGALATVISSVESVARSFLETRRGRPCERLEHLVSSGAIAVRQVALTAESASAKEVDGAREHARRVADLVAAGRRSEPDRCEGSCSAAAASLEKLLGACDAAVGVVLAR